MQAYVVSPPSEAGYFKFLHAADVPKVMKDGTVAISSLDHFRDLEERDYSLIADRLEGASEMTMPDDFVLTEGSRKLEMINNSGLGQFAAVSRGGVINISNAKIVRPLSGHIYCVSYGKIAELKQVHADYDACLRIKSIGRLARHIFRTGVVLETGQRIRDLFQRHQIGQVIYEGRTRSIEDGPMLPPSPFKKAIKYAPQRESRIFFAPRELAARNDRLIVKIDDPNSLFEEVSR